MCRIRVFSIIIAVIIFDNVCSIKVDDSVHFNFKFEHETELPYSADDLENKELLERISIRSHENEDFFCLIPPTHGKVSEESLTLGHNRNQFWNSDINGDYVDSTPSQLLAPLHSENVCSIRAEAYWTYEVCHGRFIMQFHEEKGGSLRTEYYLGNMNVEKSKVEIDLKHPPKKRIENMDMPYFPVRYTQGTPCELIEKPRTTTILYICNEYVRSQIYSITEVSTCAYEVVVLTKTICKHPSFKPPSKNIHDIVCYKKEKHDDPRPKSLAEQESRHSSTFKREYSVPEGHKIRKEQVPKPVILQSNKQDNAMEKPQRKGMGSWYDFLSGAQCLESSENAYWKYKICFGVSITQFHAEEKTGRIEIVLGEFDEKIHKAWVDQDKKARQPKKVGKRIARIDYMYAHGEICEETGAHRNVVVRLHCQKGDNPVFMFNIEEPKTCSYILDIEHSSFCEPMQTADEYGTIPLDNAHSVKF